MVDRLQVRSPSQCPKYNLTLGSSRSLPGYQYIAIQTTSRFTPSASVPSYPPHAKRITKQKRWPHRDSNSDLVGEGFVHILGAGTRRTKVRHRSRGIIASCINKRTKLERYFVLCHMCCGVRGRTGLLFEGKVSLLRFCARYELATSNQQRSAIKLCGLNGNFLVVKSCGATKYITCFYEVAVSVRDVLLRSAMLCTLPRSMYTCTTDVLTGS